jgi:chloramphenicol-sensitive protein RarD
MAARSEETKGIMYGLAAYIGWGFAPLYWPLLQPSSPYEVLAHRIIWSLVFLVLVNAAMGTWRPVMAALRDARKRRLLIVAAALITVNWGLYIWSVNNDHVVDASLGYFITPFISVVLGTTVLGERLRNAQKIAIAIAAISVIVLTFNGGQLPWIGLVLAASFGAYGYVKKLADVEAIASLTIETLVALPFGAAYLLYLEFTDQAAFLHTSFGHTLTVLSAGVITAVPLLGFGAAAVRVPLVTLGFMQYFSPFIQFSVGVWIVGEPMTQLRWIGFAFLWIGLVVYSYDMWRSSRPVA